MEQNPWAVGSWASLQADAVEWLHRAWSTIWHSSASALVVAFVVYWAMYFVMLRRQKAWVGDAWNREETHLHEISFVVAIGTALIMLGRRYLWENYRGWSIAFAVLLLLGVAGLLWVQQQRSVRLRREEKARWYR